MNYTDEQVLDILRLVTDQPESILKKWSSREDNTKLDLTKYSYPLFLYSFPIIVDGDEVATVTLAEGVDKSRQKLMSKYLTSDIYKSSWWAYSHETYLDCYLTIHKQFKLPNHPDDENFFVFESTFLDNEGKDIRYRLSYGYTESPGLFEEWARDDRYSSWRCYNFDNGVNLQVEYTNIDGWLMGEKINEVIKVRIRDQKIDELNL